MSVFTLHAAVAAVCPIHGVSMPDPADRLTWGVYFMDEATDAQRAAAQQVLQTYVNPPDPVVLTFLEFMALLTPTEQAALVNSADVPLKIWILKATGAGEIHLSDPETIKGLAYAGSIIPALTPDRQAAILANSPPV